MLGVRMVAHVQPDTGAVEVPPVPIMSYLATAARANAGLAPTTEESQPAGVVSTGVVDLTDATDDNDDNSGTISVPKVEVEDIPMEEVIEEQETAQAQYGRGMRIRKKPVSYEPVMTGKTYQRGVNNLCYTGTLYTLNDVVPFGDTPYKMGVVNLNIDTPVQVQTPDEGWETTIALRSICWV